MYTFEEIRGNTPLVEQLRRSAASGRSSHAYLFLGGAGAGKRLQIPLRRRCNAKAKNAPATAAKAAMPSIMATTLM